MHKLHDEILERLPEDFVRRMRNWSASIGGCAVSTASSTWDMAGGSSGGWYQAPIPVLVGEAVDTQTAIYKLGPLQQDVIAIFWLYHARTIAWMARATPVVREQKLGPTSFCQHLNAAHDRLQSELVRMGETAAKRRKERLT